MEDDGEYDRTLELFVEEVRSLIRRRAQEQRVARESGHSERDTVPSAFRKAFEDEE
jgi:hypothetical protein